MKNNRIEKLILNTKWLYHSIVHHGRTPFVGDDVIEKMELKYIDNDVLIHLLEQIPCTEIPLHYELNKSSENWLEYLDNFLEIVIGRVRKLLSEESLSKEQREVLSNIQNGTFFSNQGVYNNPELIDPAKKGDMSFCALELSQFFRLMRTLESVCSPKETSV